MIFKQLKWDSFILIFILVNTSASTFPFVYPRIQLKATSDPDAGTPLYITPFLKNGSIELAQKTSEVDVTEQLGLRSHAGFFTVDQKFNSNMYFWYFPPVSGDPGAPVVLWLQGGPGGSSLFGLFAELGPIRATKSGFKHRKYHWALNNHLIFIDNPVGTGFSYADDQGYCKDENCVAKNLFSALDQFFTLFPQLRGNDFYITGESYAGKYIPALGMWIHKENMKEKRINLKGIAIGNGYCDPVNQLDYGIYLYEHGMIDANQKAKFDAVQVKVTEAINKGEWASANIWMSKIFDTESSYFSKYTGFENVYNYLYPKDPVNVDALVALLSNNRVRKSVHVGGLPYNSPTKVEINLAFDILKSVAPYVAELLSYYKILIYNGQMDVIVAYPLTVNFLNHLNFSSAEEYKVANRYVWNVHDEVAGYYKVAGNLTEVLVRSAGHMVPHDQPKWAFDMISRFIGNGFKA